MISIRRYFTRTLTLMLVAGGGIAFAAAYLITDHEMEEILDAQLSLHGRVLAGQLGSETTPAQYQRIAQRLGIPGHPALVYPNNSALPPLTPPVTPPTLYHEEERNLGVGIWSKDKTPRLLTGKWNNHGLFPAPQEAGYRWVTYNDSRWRVFSLWDSASGTWLSLGLHSRFHDEIVERIAWNNLIPLLVLLPLLLWLMNRIIRRGLSPVRQLSRQVEGRSARDLSPITTPVPTEIEGLRRSLNAFIIRLEETLKRERRFTADAAHELRTPLAALRIHLDNARAGEQPSLHKAYTGVERLQRVVEQLLVLARLDRTTKQHADVIDIYPTVSDIMADLWPQANARQQHLELTGRTRLQVAADDVQVGILVRNLIDNALRYTPENGNVTVELGTAEGKPYLAVYDTGPGIPPELLHAVTERFRRAADQLTTGSGLGLSIVLELAERQHARLTLHNRQSHGLEARITWPALPAESRSP